MHKCFISLEKIHECWHTFKDLFLIAADKHVPIVTRRVRGYSVPLLTSDLKRLMQQQHVIILQLTLNSLALQVAVLTDAGQDNQ